MKRPSYSVEDMVCASLVVHAQQGFVRSGMGTVTFDEEDNEVVTKDNKTVVKEMLDAKTEFPEDIRTQARELIDSINGKLMLKKLTGAMGSFDNSIHNALNQSYEQSGNYGLSIIASLPHSVSVDKQREKINDQMARLKHSSDYFGEKGKRYDIDVAVADIKFIQKSGVYMITCVYKDRDIIKFWWRDQPDISDIIRDRTISIRGTVNKHEFSRYTNAKETMLNRVKISGFIE